MNTYKKFLLGLFLVSFFFLFPQKIYAVTVSFSNLPSTINLNQEVTIGVNVECSGCGDSYMRGVFYESGINYFGLTQNNIGEWIGTSDDKTKYFKMASDSGQLKIKIQTDDSKYTGPKNYFFKVARYTSSGSATWSSESQIYVNGPTPTPTSTPTTTPTATSTSSSTPTATPTTSPTKSSTPKPSPTKTSTPTPTPTSSSEVLGESISESSIEPPPAVENTTSEKKNFPFLPVILIGSGLSMVGLAVLQLINAAKNSKKDPPLASPDNMGGSNI